MPSRLTRVVARTAPLVVAACMHVKSAQAPSRVANADDPGNAVVVAGLQQLRVATAPYKHLDAAIAAGYSKTGGSCVIDEHHGAMGYHHVNPAYIDAKLDPARPEMLLYERMPDDSYKLNGAEFMVPYRYWPRDSAAPVLMGQKLHHENNLNYWYLHVWAWTDNKDGLFANMNPDVHCPDGGKVYKASADSL